MPYYIDVRGNQATDKLRGKKKMNITISMETGNDAFNSDADIARALVKLAERIKRNGIGGVSKVMDDNGNSVGTVDITQ